MAMAKSKVRKRPASWSMRRAPWPTPNNPLTSTVTGAVVVAWMPRTKRQALPAMPSR